MQFRNLLVLVVAIPLASPAMANEGYDEPRVEMARDALGEQARVQRYYYRGGIDIDLGKLTLAQRKMLRSTFGPEADAPLRSFIECPAGLDGVINLWSCKQVEQDFSDGRETALLSRMFSLFDIALPKLPAMSPSEAARRPRRFVQFDANIIAGPAHPEFPDGALVDKSEIVGLDSARSQINFPPRALREEAYGRLIALCQVQADLSVACTQQRFEPEEHSSYFSMIAPNLFLADRVGSALANGQPSVGARFEFAVNFTINGG